MYLVCTIQALWPGFKELNNQFHEAKKIIFGLPTATTPLPNCFWNQKDFRKHIINMPWEDNCVKRRRHLKLYMAWQRRPWRPGTSMLIRSVNFNLCLKVQALDLHWSRFHMSKWLRSIWKLVTAHYYLAWLLTGQSAETGQGLKRAGNSGWAQTGEVTGLCIVTASLLPQLMAVTCWGSPSAHPFCMGQECLKPYGHSQEAANDLGACPTHFPYMLLARGAYAGGEGAMGPTLGYAGTFKPVPFTWNKCLPGQDGSVCLNAHEGSVLWHPSITGRDRMVGIAFSAHLLKNPRINNWAMPVNSLYTYYMNCASMCTALK